MSEGFTTTLPSQLNDPIAAMPGVGNPVSRRPTAQTPATDMANTRADFINQTWFAIHKDSKNPELAAKLMNHFINDPEVTKIWGMEIGPVCNSEMRKVQAANYTEGEKKVNAAIERYLNDKAFGIGPLPAAFTKMRPFVTEANEKVAFGQATPEEAAEEFFDNEADIFPK